MATNLPTVSRGAADSVAAPQKTLCFMDTGVTAKDSVDLSQWMGDYVEIQVLGDAYDLCFSDSGSDTFATTDVAFGDSGSADLVGRRLADGDTIHRVVPRSRSILVYEPVNGTSSDIRIWRA